jgi:hypothetical protein
MNVKQFYRYVFVFLLSVFVFTGCGNSNSGGEFDGDGSNSGNQKTTITGYVEDDPMPNAKIKVTDEANNLIVETTSDANGKYTLQANFIDGKVYTLESKGKLGDRNITLHSIFKFSADTVINANPITELKYQLVQSGKTIEDAEVLIRDYFAVVSGEKLERNRFDANGALAVGMADLAKLYDGLLPVDAIEKIKEDILRNEGLDVKDYSYRTLLLNKITLEASASSLKLGEEVTVKVIGVTELNENYELKWSGIPEDAREDNNSKIFTITDNAQDVYVRASLYKKDDNRSLFISSADVTINFYKELTENNLTVENASIENNLTVGENSITVPAGTLTDGKVIRVQELQTGSDSTVAQFAIDAGGAVDGTIVFNYKYDPYLVAEPRNLQISLRSGDEVKVLSVIDIDYAEHIVRFGIPLNGGINRAYGDINEVFLEYLSTPATKRQILDFFGLDNEKYKTYLKEVLIEYLGQVGYYGSGENRGAEKLLFEKDDNGHYNGMEKLTKVLSEIDINGKLKFNNFANAINIMKAYEISARLHRLENYDSTSWATVYNHYLQQQYGYTSSVTGLEYANEVIERIIEINKIPSVWVGNVKLTESQTSSLKYAKFATNVAISYATGSGLLDFGISAGGIAIDSLWPADLGGNSAGIAYSALTNTKEFLGKSVSIGGKSFSVSFIKDVTIGLAVNKVFADIEKNLLEDNAIATTPIWLSLYFHKDEILKIDSKFDIPYSVPSSKNTFVNIMFPEIENCEGSYQDKYYCENRKLILDAPNDGFLTFSFDDSAFSKTLDPTKRLNALFLGNTVGMDISEEERAIAYMLLLYAYGDNSINDIFEGILKSSKAVIFKYLLEAMQMENDEIGEPQIFEVNNEFVHDIVISDKYSLTEWDVFMNSLGVIRGLRESQNIVISHIKNSSSFDKIMELAKLKWTNSQLETFNIKKIKMETYGVGLKYSEDDNAWILDRTDTAESNYTVTENINDKFTYDSDLEKNVLSFATLFEGEDFTPFDNKLVGFKVTLVVEKAGVEKVVSKDFIFTTLADTEHLVQTDFTGATLKSSAKDAYTGNPIANAQVTLVPGGLTDFTDAEGNYEVSGLAAGNYTIVISKEGYRQVEATLTLVEDETKVYEASLGIDDEHATTIGGANITLKDAINGNVVTNGYVKVREGQNNKTGEVVQEIVNNDGNQSVNISLYPNTYTVEVGANGYSHSFNTITILGDVNGTYEFSITPVLEADQVRAVLTWGAIPSDLDSHLVKKTNGNEDYHIYYSNMRPANADANLDTDDTSSYGPETITINNVNDASVYTYYVYNFLGGAGSVLPNSGAKLEVYFGDQSRTFYVPNEEGQYWKVFEIVNGEIIPCTSGCVKDDTSTLIRKLDSESALFSNLPSKE